MSKLVVFALSLFVAGPAFANITSPEDFEKDVIKAGTAIIAGKTVVLTTADGKKIILSTPTVQDSLTEGS